jgi:hypothetical protein
MEKVAGIFTLSFDHCYCVFIVIFAGLVVKKKQTADIFTWIEAEKTMNLAQAIWLQD